MLGESGAAAQPCEEGLDRLLKEATSGGSSGKLGDWVAANLRRRLAHHKDQARLAMDVAAKSTNAKVAKAALLLEASLGFEREQVTTALDWLNLARCAATGNGKRRLTHSVIENRPTS